MLMAMGLVTNSVTLPVVEARTHLDPERSADAPTPLSDASQPSAVEPESEGQRMATNVPTPAQSEPTQPLRVHVSWGHISKNVRAFRMSFASQDAKLSDLTSVGFEPGDALEGGVCRTRAGAGDVDGMDFTLVFPARTIREIGKVQPIWSYLLANSDANTVRRLRQDAGFRPDSRKLTVQMNEEGTSGFSVTVDQLLIQRAVWVPELNVFLAAGDPPLSFEEHQQALQPWAGQRVLEQLEREPEASYEQYRSRWEDMGSPAYQNPASVAPGHIVCLSWDSAIPKFGIDRGGNVWNDYGNPDHFHLGFDFGELGKNLTAVWKGQQLTGGLPVITTTIERDGVRYELEQFAYPLHGPPAQRRGDIEMVLLQKLRLTELNGRSGDVLVGLTHRRERREAQAAWAVRTNGPALVWEEPGSGRVLLAVAGDGVVLHTNTARVGPWQTNRIVLQVKLPAHGSTEFVVKLPSSPAASAERETLLALDHAASRETTLKFWTDYLARGARFEVPEEAVNALFQANLWHALRLPRRHGAAGADVKLDLPYSNFAYDQQGTPWPVNQCVYVDYMLYDLRGYHAIAGEELATMYRNNQQANGHVGGFANWGVYTPSMIYAVAQHCLLQGDRAVADELLPPTLKALDWCLAEMKQAADRGGAAAGLMLGPLNDLSHEAKPWAFNQTYLFAGPALLARVLAERQHPRAAECRAAAGALYEAVLRGFGRASVAAPLVQMRDHTWMPYVPGDALDPRRLFEVWYPTDVDTGPLHLSRLKALDPNGPLTTCLLNDHEDNLFLEHWGMANEPVYNQHATTYLLRDDVKPAIRAFYSMMACAFSHSTFEPVEHRWGWGQYFGPPSTDGAWFELYRQMLIREADDDTLWLCQAVPRKWLEHGKQIRVRQAPTYYGPLNLTVGSRATEREISADIELTDRKRPGALLLRLRHPEALRLQSVTVNGAVWTDFDPAKEWIRIPRPTEGRYAVVARY
jgi:hypothetical protein